MLDPQSAPSPRPLFDPNSVPLFYQLTLTQTNLIIEALISHRDALIRGIQASAEAQITEARRRYDESDTNRRDEEEKQQRLEEIKKERVEEAAMKAASEAKNEHRERQLARIKGEKARWKPSQGPSFHPLADDDQLDCEVAHDPRGAYKETGGEQL